MIRWHIFPSPSRLTYVLQVLRCRQLPARQDQAQQKDMQDMQDVVWAVWGLKRYAPDGAQTVDGDVV